MNSYLYIARPDHWFKNVLMLPGAGLAVVLADASIINAVGPILIAIFSTCLAASANYVINEWLDAQYDRYHPLKKRRPAVQGRVKAGWVCLEYLALIAAGLGLAALLSRQFLVFAVLLLVMGVIYNVRPFRTKDRAYLDVLSESANNPLRFLLGWSAVVADALPPSSVLLAYWTGGAFLMAVKRYAEYRFFDDPARAGRYRKSFRVYTEDKLLLSAFFYALCSAFFLGVFLIKYRIEFLLSFPLFALLFTWYLAIGMKPRSAAQSPEKFYYEPGFTLYVIVLSAVVALLFVVDIPWLQVLVERLEY